MTITSPRTTTQANRSRIIRKPAGGAPPTTASTIVWTHIPLVPQVALVGHLDGMPVAVIDQLGNAGFRATLCDGSYVEAFRTLDECKRAVARAVARK